MTQNDRILNALRAGRRLTTHEIHMGLGGPWIASPSKRIDELRKGGHPIADEWVYSDRAKYKRYFLAEGLGNQFEAA